MADQKTRAIEEARQSFYRRLSDLIYDLSQDPGPFTFINSEQSRIALQRAAENILIARAGEHNRKYINVNVEQNPDDESAVTITVGNLYTGAILIGLRPITPQLLDRKGTVHLQGYGLHVNDDGAVFVYTSGQSEQVSVRVKIEEIEEEEHLVLPFN